MDEKLQILIIADDEVDRMTICRAFINAGVSTQMLQVVDSKNAIATLNDASYDCVFLDNCLSNSDIESFSLLKKIRSLENSVPIIALVENSNHQITEKLIAAGATNYLRKSLLSAEILELAIRSAIAIHQTQVRLAVANQKLEQNQQSISSKSQKIQQQKQQLDLQNLKLIEALRLKSQFLSTISHELRTPMNAIIGFSQLLLRPKCGILSQQQKEMAECILHNAKNLLILVNEILEFSKLQAGKLDLKPEILDLSKLVNTTVTEIRPLASAKQLSVEVEINLPNPILYNDQNKLRDIISNLLANAVKFTNNGSIRVKIAEANNIIQLEIEDTGIGIAANDIQYIFEPFRQIDQGTDRKFGGTGLGLSVVHGLVNMMEGKITVESELGKGSRFRVQLPRQLSFVLERDIVQANDDSESRKFVNNQKGENSQRELQSKNQPR